MKRQEKLEKLIEGLLFLTAKEWKAEEIAKLLKADGQEVKEALQKLAERFNNLDIIIAVRKIGDYYSMNVKPEYVPLLKRFIKAKELTRKQARLLAIIEANKGIKKSVLAKKLGSAVYESIGELVKMGFVTEVKEDRTSRLFTTEKYKEYRELYK